jgi:L-ascorbate metabolism protein UlaG (beta-lactamase superfamily)
MSAFTFNKKISMTYISTATAILDIDGITFFIDFFFSPAGTEFNGSAKVLKVHDDPAMKLNEGRN